MHCILPLLEQPALLRLLRVVDVKVIIRVARRHASSRRPVEKAELKQVGLDDVHDRVRLFADRGGDGFEAYGPALELANDHFEHATVDLVEAELVDLEQVERGTSNRPSDLAFS